MNKLLLSNKPKDISNEKFVEMWNSSGYSLEALHKTLLVLKSEISSIKKDDFDCPNHYAKLAYNLGQERMIDLIVSMLPETAKP